MPTTTYLPETRQEQEAILGPSWANATPRRKQLSSDNALEFTAERSIRVASRLSSFASQLEDHLAWHEGRQTDIDGWPRVLSGKRKHKDDRLKLHQPAPEMTPLQRKQTLYLCQMIRDITNDGEGQSAFDEEATHACTLTWNYLVRKFHQQDLDRILLQTIAYAKVLMKSELTPIQESRLLQEVPGDTPTWWQGKAYFPYDLRLQDVHRLDLETYDLRVLQRASLQLRFLQQMKSISTSSPSSGGEQIRDSWEFLKNDRDLARLDYDSHHLALAPMIPHYQETLREILTMYRLWLSTSLREEDFLWIRRVVVSQLIPRDTLHRYFADSLWATTSRRTEPSTSCLPCTTRSMRTIKPSRWPSLCSQTIADGT